MSDFQEKKDEGKFGGPFDPDMENGGRRGSTTVQGRKMSRIGPPPKLGSIPVDSDDGDQQTKLIEMEAENGIKYRTCSWQKTAALLFSEYICLAIMSFPYSYSILGLVPGLILTVVVAGFVLYTSLIVWEFCLRHPEVRDVTDIGKSIVICHCVYMLKFCQDKCSSLDRRSPGTQLPSCSCSTTRLFKACTY